jgi:hypothetical protein
MDRKKMREKALKNIVRNNKRWINKMWKKSEQRKKRINTFIVHCAGFMAENYSLGFFDQT